MGCYPVTLWDLNLLDAKDLMNLKGGPSATQSSKETPAPDDTWMVTWWDPGAEVHVSHAWTPDPQKLWENKCVLSTAWLVLMGYADIDDSHTCLHSDSPRVTQGVTGKLNGHRAS